MATVLCAVSLPTLADVYVRVEQDVPLYSDLPDSPGFRLVLKDATNATVREARAPSAGRKPRQAFVDMVDAAAREAGVEANLLHAVIAVESGYEPTAVSARGAVGLMQLMPDTARRFGIADRRDPRQNLRAGARYLAELLQRFHGNLELTLAAYNAGERAVERAGQAVPNYPETRQYVPAVMRHYRAAERLDGTGPPA